MSVRALIDRLEKEDSKSTTGSVVWSENQEEARDYVPRYILGNIVLHTLVHSFFVVKSESELVKMIESYGQQEGLRDYRLSKTVLTTNQMLNNLREHAVYNEIQAARQRVYEVLFLWSSPIGAVHGVIDLLYQNQDGDWYLLYWKTDYIIKQNLKDLQTIYRKQLSLYYHTVKNILNINSKPQLAFLNPNIYLIKIVPEEISILNMWANAS